MLSVLQPDEVAMLGGLPADAIAGVLEGAGTATDRFRPNPHFAALMHRVIAATGPSDPGLQAAARSQGEGWVYVVDLRTPEGPQGRVPPEDIVGAFQVRGGVMVPESYQVMETHQIYTSNGLVTLPPTLRQALVDELRRQGRPA